MKRPAAASDSDSMKRPAAAMKRPSRNPSSRDRSPSVFRSSDEESKHDNASDGDEVFPESDVDAPSEMPAEPLPRPPAVADIGVESMMREWFDDLPDVRANVVCGLRRLTGTRNTNEVYVASICTGWGVADMVIDSLNNVVQQSGVRALGDYPKAVVKFMCEIEPAKQEYLSQAFPGVPLYADMMELGDGLAMEYNSGEKQKVPEVDVVVVGYPCKSISGQNCKAKSFLDESSSTGGGFAGLMKFVEAKRPMILVAENVKNMECKRKKFDGEVPIDIQNQALERRGYRCFHLTVNSAKFGLRQSRARTWAMYFKKEERFAWNPLEMVKMFYCKPYPVEMFLSCREGASAKAMLKFAEKQDRVKTAKGKADVKKLKWHKAFAQVRDKLGKEQVDLNLAKLRTFAMPLTERELAILATAVTELEQRGFKPHAERMFVQVDQNFQRGTFLKGSLGPTFSPCLIPKGKYIVTARWSLLSVKEKMLLQGVGLEEYSKYNMDTVSPSKFADMIGNAFSAPVCTAFVLSSLAAFGTTDA